MGQLWSLATTVIQVRLRIQMNTALYAKTLIRKDVASSSSSRPASVAGGEGEAQKDVEDDDFSSKVCVRFWLFNSLVLTRESGTDNDPHDHGC
jgi:hypothetical protein